jgi:hypothetical protein
MDVFSHVDLPPDNLILNILYKIIHSVSHVYIIRWNSAQHYNIDRQNRTRQGYLRILQRREQYK